MAAIFAAPPRASCILRNSGKPSCDANGLTRHMDSVMDPAMQRSFIGMFRLDAGGCGLFRTGVRMIAIATSATSGKPPGPPGPEPAPEGGTSQAPAARAPDFPP